MSYLMSGMYALPLCVPINCAYKEAAFWLSYVRCVHVASVYLDISFYLLLVINLISH